MALTRVVAPSWSRQIGIALLALLPALPLQASSSDPGKVIAGWVEKVTLVDSGTPVKAKLDTGAKTSSVHAINIEEFRRDGKKWVRFELELGDRKHPQRVKLERPRLRGVRIKEHDGSTNRRPVVELPICFDGRRYKTQFNLVDRGSFLYPVLLGRAFLKGIAVIDPDQTFVTQAHCDLAMSPPVPPAEMAK